ncbi:hypothetical protein PVAP13_9NG420800 [Panicum virgatum]|uniref:Uncharacterized protein n=1 Tax=Panicum virgatum TaxID=38727 RepID=A0A8T0MTP7_PANVG|nr:hypothetical protein PVAP13_9NG420800 [Panicum virgatum]
MNLILHVFMSGSVMLASIYPSFGVCCTRVSIGKGFQGIDRNSYIYFQMLVYETILSYAIYVSISTE